MFQVESDSVQVIDSIYTQASTVGLSLVDH
jgi:hypothetical protein